MLVIQKTAPHRPECLENNTVACRLETGMVNQRRSPFLGYGTIKSDATMEHEKLRERTATAIHTTLEELLEAMFSVRSAPAAA
jgi:hypothetical protein